MEDERYVYAIATERAVALHTQVPRDTDLPFARPQLHG
jgi:hypothetical protein